MRAIVGLALVGAFVWVAAATADHLEPTERIRAVDAARARAMLLRRADLGTGYVVERTSDLDPHVTCKALDLSDLVVTGEAISPRWSREFQITGSSTAVYATGADGEAAWRRGTSLAGMRCLRDEFRNAFARQGEAVRVVLRPIAFPKLASARVAYRLVLSGAMPGPPLAYLDFVVLKQGRAQAVLLFAGVLAPPDRAREIVLARVVAARMAKAMRGA